MVDYLHSSGGISHNRHNVESGNSVHTVRSIPIANNSPEFDTSRLTASAVPPPPSHVFVLLAQLHSHSLAQEREVEAFFHHNLIMPSKELIVSEKGDIPTKLVDGKPTYVYWNILGLAQSARLALIAANVDFVDVRVEASISQDGWLAAKHTDEMQKVLSFPNLPYFLHPDLGDRGLVQSDSILRFIGTKYGMLGSSPAHTDMYLEHLHDAESTIANLSYGRSADKVLEWYKKSVPGYLEPFGKLLANQKYLSESDEPGVADFKLYVFLYKLTVIQEQLGDEMTKSIIGDDAEWIKTYMERVEAIPAVKTYMSSASYMKGFLNNPSAKWRG